MSKLSFNIIKNKYIKKTPFKFIVYVFEDYSQIMIEEPSTGKCVRTNTYNINNYLSYIKSSTKWKRLPDQTYVKIENDDTFQFLPMFQDKFRFVNLSFNLVRCDNYRLQESPSTSVVFPDNFKFETKRFKLMRSENSTIKIEATLPLFQVYSIFKNNEQIGIQQVLTCMKWKNSFFRYPYGNSNTNDCLCYGDSIHKFTLKNDIYAYYLKLLIPPSNNDYAFHLRYGNEIPSSLEINQIREKINNNDFKVSLIDMLYYLSQCETIQDINLDVFLLTPNIPEEILEYEKNQFEQISS